MLTNSVTLGAVSQCWALQIGCYFIHKQYEAYPCSIIGMFNGTFRNIVNVMGSKCT